jgi:inner membrane protein involved in colicin E2 resistance
MTANYVLWLTLLALVAIIMVVVVILVERRLVAERENVAQRLECYVDGASSGSQRDA